MFLKALLVALWVTWGLIDEQTFQFQTTRPIITGPVVGLILGDVKTGLLVGATVELMFLAVVFVGTAVPPDPTLSSAIATAFAILTGKGADIAVATALPVALIGQVVTTLQYTVVNVFFLHRGDKYAAEGNLRGLTLMNTLPLLMNFIFYGLPAFLAVYYGPTFVKPYIDMIPAKIIQGLAAGGGMIGAVGFALLLKSIKALYLWPYFAIGFIASAYLKINILGIGLLAITAAALHSHFMGSQKYVESPRM
ncbi:MAG: PTS sugar transporter subunit IIC [Thermosediminibacteraceae bacterium]|nr:PTS sugar transporter subunit IIC [Thermosediminibacteraceae bacterium]